MNDKKVQINKRGKGRVSREEIQAWSKEELISKVLQLDAYNFQIRNLLQKKLGQSDGEFYEQLAQLESHERSTAVRAPEPVLQPNKVQQKRQFDFNKSYKRHVLIKFLYFGWDYHGLAVQEDSNATIEHHLFQALIRTCLIQSRESANYHRCGRTDKEVSAFCQVISIDLRSKFPPDEQLKTESLANEIDYCSLLNRVLPRSIQAVAWMPLRSPVYSARFDCFERTYRYYFPIGDLNIEAMQKGCELLARHTDFRNFCKMDVNNGVTNYIRQIFKASVRRCEVEQNNKNAEDGYAMYMLEIRANAFLWHQIRCIMAVLLLIGEGKEQPEVIDELLDVQKNPCKPQYTPAIGLPLNLFHCEYRKHTIQPADNTSRDACAEDEAEHTTAWIYGDEHLQKLIETVQGEWTQYNIKSTMIRDLLHQLEQIRQKDHKCAEPVNAQAWLLQDGVRPRQYQQLLNRKRCESLENRIEHFIKKQRLIVADEPAAKLDTISAAVNK
ncbi:PREDICTED: tRNA pseudouridine(38/39) synthase isoform X2 [Rhagoletis zephyria]|uniref:tRNA pseudouridine(38/39) synthase isoform X2 n=1 Tax=Rhagoletis zephyria TaxID=28612 RepID=UPI0008115590|nr:PREDICTED: tRNA pseudouridine(38/39) synthase isoform X2 [Rhagoletis zephyria]